MRRHEVCALYSVLGFSILTAGACKSEGTANPKSPVTQVDAGGSDATADDVATAEVSVDAGSDVRDAMPIQDVPPNLPGDVAVSSNNDVLSTRAPDPDEVTYLKRPLPVFIISTDGPIPNEPKGAGRLRVIEEHDGTLVDIAKKVPDLESDIGIELRGVTSRDLYLQKPYGFEIRDSAGLGRQAAFMGLPREADWTLISCYSDKSCMRNALTYAIGREIGAQANPPRTWWAPRTRWVEVYLNNAYNGLYLFVEKIKADKFRMDISTPAADMTAGDITGSYVISGQGGFSAGAERDWKEPLWLEPLTPAANYFWRYRHPYYLDMSAAQKTYIQTSMTNLQLLFKDDPDWKSKYRKVIDVPSWIDYHLVQELTHNVDAYFKSNFLHKAPDSAGGKWSLGPLWDYDFALGNVSFDKYYCVGRLVPPQDFFTPLMKIWSDPDPAMLNEAKCRWNELRKTGGPLDIARIEEKIDAWHKFIAVAKARDNSKWKTIGANILGNNYVGATFDDEIAYLKYWIRLRVAWLDKHLYGTCGTVPAPGPVAALPMPPARQAPNRPTVGWARLTPKYIAVDVPNTEPLFMEWSCPDSTQ